MKRITLLTILATVSVTAQAQFNIGKGEADTIYQKNCASCHGKDLNGGMGSSLIDDVWKFGGSDAEITQSIANGITDAGMPGWKTTLSEQDIRALVIYMREQKHLSEATALEQKTKAKNGVFATEQHNFKLEKVAQADSPLWGMDFLPDGSILATEKAGTLWHYSANGKATKVTGTPEVWLRGQGGLLDVAIHPDYANNGWVYLSYSEHKGAMVDGKKAGMTAISRGKLVDGKWSENQLIFSSDTKFHNNKAYHFGSRIVMKDGYLFFSVGDRGTQDEAQDTSLPNGKVHRIFDDGRIPQDNPFIGKGDAYATIWSYGNRNPQGMALHPETRDLWASEHGPRGGDEVNQIQKGKNYGWPVITYGMNYNGTPITDKTHMEGMEQPKHFWTPSIATAGIDFYTGKLFAKWRGNLFVGGMSAQVVQRLVIKDNKVVADEVILKGQGRVRDIANGPDGTLYIMLNTREPKTGGIYKLVPVN